MYYLWTGLILLFAFLCIYGASKDFWRYTQVIDQSQEERQKMFDAAVLLVAMPTASGMFLSFIMMRDGKDIIGISMVGITVFLAFGNTVWRQLVRHEWRRKRYLRIVAELEQRFPSEQQ